MSTWEVRDDVLYVTQGMNMYTRNTWSMKRWAKTVTSATTYERTNERQTTPKSPKIIMMDKIMYNKITGDIYTCMDSNRQPCTYLLLVHTKERGGMTTSHMHTQIHGWG